MGYSFTGRIVTKDTKKLLAEFDAGRLKDINHRAYSGEFFDVDSQCGIKDEDYRDALSAVHISQVGIYSKDVVSEISALKPYKPWYNTKMECYAIDADVYENIIEQFNKHCPPDAISYTEDPDAYVSVYKVSVYPDKGYWYSISDFEAALADVRSRLARERDEVAKHIAIRHSKDYYEMSDNARDSLISDIGYGEDAIEELEREEAVLVWITNILDFYGNSFAIPIEGSEYDSHDWNERSVMLHLSVD